LLLLLACEQEPADPAIDAALVDASMPVKTAPHELVDASRARVADAASDGAAPVDAATSDDGLTCYPILAHGGDFKHKYRPGIAHDAYTAFTWQAPWKETAYAVLMRPVLDNTKVLHHWLLFEDDAPGGEPGPAVVENGIHPSSTLIAAWVPGQDPIDLRKSGHDVAFELRPDTTYTLEAHYNSDDADAEDASGVEVCTVARKPANIASYSWLGWENLGFPSDHWTGVCHPNYAQGPIHVLSIVPHMHLKGRHAKVTVQRADGGTEVVHDDDFDFSYERLYPTDLTLRSGDAIRSDCSYSEPMTYGPRVADEMCYVFTLAYPKQALTSPDLVGGVIHGAGTCFGQ
jgi:hypothetical protein